MDRYFKDRGKNIRVSKHFYDWLGKSLTLPRSTIFCAVWSKEPEKDRLLSRHQECVLSQTTSPFPLYVFDDSDEPPADFELPYIACDQPLTIYEAWDLAVRIAPSDLVQNLNLDDVVYPNANAVLIDALLATGSDLVGGEWLIVRQDNDVSFLEKRVSTVSEVLNTDYDPNWPPANFTAMPRRLGSGTGERGTYGPSTLWRRSTTGFGYPHKFNNGEKIKSIGDSAFWSKIKTSGRSATRLPVIIGEYFTNPEHQAEFRENTDLIAASSGISWEITE